MTDARDVDGPASAAMREAGLARPVLGWWGWLGDRHVIAALAAAVPVWLALAAGWGGSMAAPAGLAAWFGFVVLQPAAEELAFRGVLQGWLLRRDAARRWGLVTRANVFTSVAFASLHLPWQPVGWAFAVLAPSLLLGHLRERQGSVLPCVALHAVYNAGFACVAWWLHG